MFRSFWGEQLSFDHHEADEIQPDVMSFTAVIGAHARGSCVEGATDLFLGSISTHAEETSYFGLR